MKECKENIFEWLLSHGNGSGAVTYHNFTEWKRVYFKNADKWETAADRAIAGGYAADCVAYAFWAGLQAGIRSLFKNLPEGCAAAFCVTEADGNRPRNIKSTIRKSGNASGTETQWLLNGEKHYISGALEADLFFVAASEGRSSSGKNSLKMATVYRGSPGLSIIPMSNLKILPEITHGIVSFDNVEAGGDRILPGDAYSDYIKPFRTVEDLFVISAFLGYLFKLSRIYEWPKFVSAKAISLMVSARALCINDPAAAWVHIALGVLLEDIIKYFKELGPCWKITDENISAGWERDTAIMSIAQEARAKRIDRAWRFYSTG